MGYSTVLYSDDMIKAYDVTWGKALLRSTLTYLSQSVTYLHTYIPPLR